MSLQDDKDTQRRRKPRTGEEAEDTPTALPGRRPPAGEVGNALRSAYQRMVDEDIPPEMLDLLGKLG